MSVVFSYATKRGTFRITQRADGRWTLWFKDEALENHPSAQSAAEAVADGGCFWPSIGDPSELGIPEDVSEWERSRA